MSKTDFYSNILKQENMTMVKKHNFTKSIQQIEEFGKMATKEIEITPVQTEGTFIPFNDHNVTGDELNDVITEIQEHLIEVNKLQIKFVREFSNVYDAFNYLDKDYIDAINNNIHSIGVVSKQALTASKQANEAAIQAQMANKNVEAAVDTQKKIVDTLCIFKADIDKIKHIWNIDEIWENTEDARKKINKLGDELKKLHGVVDATALQTENSYNRIQEQLNNLSADINQAFALGEQANEAAIQAQMANKNVEEAVDTQKKIVDTLCIFKADIDKIKHIWNIDEIWENTEDAREKINKLGDELKKLHGVVDATALQTENSYNRIQEQLNNLSADINQAFALGEQANEAAIQAQMANKNVEEAVDTQKKIVDTLCIFKADIDKIKHIWNIDEIWENTEDAREKINKLGDELKKLHGVVDATALQTESNYNRIQDQLKNLSADINQTFALGEQANEAAVQAQKANKNVEEDLAKLHEAFDDVVLQIENSQNSIQKQFEDVASKIKQLKNDTEEENAQLTDRITKQEQQISRLNFVSTTALIVGIAGILLYIRGIV